MTVIKDGWLVEPLPVFFEDEDAAWNFANVFGGVPVRTKRQDGWFVESLPVFFDDEDAAWNFADMFGGVPGRAKRQTEAAEDGEPAWCSVDEDGSLYQADGKARPLGEFTEDDSAC